MNIKITCRLLLLCSFIICLAPHFFLKLKYFVNAPFIDYDLFLALILMLYFRVTGLFLLILFWLFEFTLFFSNTYHFVKVNEFVDTVRFIQFIDLKSVFLNVNIILVFSLLILLVIINNIFEILGAFKAYCLKIMGAAFGVVFLFDLISGQNGVYRHDLFPFSFSVAGSSTLALSNSLILAESSRKISTIENEITIEDIVDFDRIANESNDFVIFILVESLGEVNNAELNAWLSNTLNIPGYSVNKTMLRFKGATTNGELRSLCGLRGDYHFVTKENLSSCIPQKFSDKGWNTIGYHGFSQYMYDRYIWWPLLGFNTVLFQESEEMLDKEKCGIMIVGVCDRIILDLIFDDKDRKNSKDFYYFLTLGTHLPVVPNLYKTPINDKCNFNKISNLTCNHIFNLGSFFMILNSKISKNKKKPIVIIVGDHAPPFSSPEDRNVFNSNYTPAYVLSPMRSR